MAANTLTLEIDTSGAQEAIAQIADIGNSLPFDARQKFADRILGLIDRGALKIAEIGGSSAASTGDRISRLGLLGFDELLAAARAAAEGDLTG